MFFYSVIGHIFCCPVYPPGAGLKWLGVGELFADVCDFILIIANADAASIHGKLIQVFDGVGQHFAADSKCIFQFDEQFLEFSEAHSVCVLDDVVHIRLVLFG